MKMTFCPVGSTEAVKYAAAFLSETGTYIPTDPGSAQMLLMDVPSLNEAGQLRSGKSSENLLATVSADTLIVGGNLDHPVFSGRPVLDLLKDPFYVAENAYLTAEAALDIALPYLSITLRNCPVLILGWGRIGKCLAQLLRAIQADVTVAARNIGDIAIIRALGYQAADIYDLGSLSQYRLILNTVPVPVMRADQAGPNSVLIDLASHRGISGDEVIVARGLPGIHYPESSGKLIAQTIIRKEENS